jgi:hypothetical protein
VAEAQTSAKQGSLTRGKAILIAVLGVVLVVVLYVQFGRRGETLAAETAEYRPRQTPATPPPVPATAAAKPAATPATQVTPGTKAPAGTQVVAVPIIDETKWKAPPLAKVVAFDPFALPAAFPQPAKVTKDGKVLNTEGLIAAAAADDAKRLADAIEKLQTELEELKQRGVHVIIRERDQYAAMIGDRMLHVGDEINGFTVTAIDPNGVHVERKESP